MGTEEKMFPPLSLFLPSHPPGHGFPKATFYCEGGQETAGGPTLGSFHGLLWTVPREAVPGEDPAHAVNEGEHDEESDDCRDRMANSAHVICNEYVDAVEQGPQDGGSPRAPLESPGHKQQHRSLPRDRQVVLEPRSRISRPLNSKPDYK